MRLGHDSCTRSLRDAGAAPEPTLVTQDESRGHLGRFEQSVCGHVVHLLFAARHADARRDALDDERGLTPLQGHGGRPRCDLAVLADDALHGRLRLKSPSQRIRSGS